MQKYAFDNKDNTFFTELKERVNNYFASNNIHPSGSSKILWKSVILIATAVMGYLAVVFIMPVTWWSVFVCVLLGINLALIGFNVMHDGGHQSFSRYPWVNVIAAHFLNALGGNAYFWQVKHNINHHTYTNIEGMDSDIDVKPFMRLHVDQPLRPYHRFQHIYWIVLYAISYLAWVFYEDFQKYFSGRISKNSPVKKMSLRQHYVFWVTKLFYVFAYIVVPIYWVGWLPWLIGFVIVTFVCGLVISVVFQLAHVVQQTRFYTMDTTDQKHNWAIHQLQSTADFATQNRLLHWMLGGLNFQVEHHLFPRISHIHYPVIAKYVKQTCADYGVVYHEYKTMLSAFISHLIHLYALGRPAKITK